MIFLTVSILEAIYIIFFLRYFKTKFSVGIMYNKFFNRILKHQYFAHPEEIPSEPISWICPFGHDVSFLLAFIIISRGILYETHYSYIKREKVSKYIYAINWVIFVIAFLICLTNLNALLYLLPIFIIEYVVFLNKKIHNKIPSNIIIHNINQKK